MSLAALAAATAYSKSSWQRYLSGRALPPRDAVQALAELSGADAARLLALWRLADSSWSGRDAQHHDTAAGNGPPPPKSHVPPVHSPEPAVETSLDATPADTGHDRPAAGAAHHTPTAGRPERRAVPVAVPAGVTAALVLTGVVMASVLAAVVLTRATAEESPGPVSGAERLVIPCRGHDCTGQDSEQGETDCWSDARTHAVRTVSGRTVELRHSAKCEAVWGRIRDPRPADRVWVETTDSRRQSRQVTVPGHALYTLMLGVDSPADARACYDLGDGPSGCTGRGR